MRRASHLTPLESSVSISTRQLQMVDLPLWFLAQDRSRASAQPQSTGIPAGQESWTATCLYCPPPAVPEQVHPDRIR